MFLLIRGTIAGSLVLIALAFAGHRGWLGAPSPALWGVSQSAWVARLLICLSLASLSVPHSGYLRAIRILASLHILTLGFCGMAVPAAPSNPLYIPFLSAITLFSFALALLCLETRVNAAVAAVPWLALGGIVLNATTLLGYLYHSSPLYGGVAGTVGITSASASLLMGFALMASAGSHRLPLRLLAGGSITAQLLRSLLPVTCGAMLLGELLSDFLRGDRGGSSTVQDALQTLISTIFITGVVLVFARRVGRRLEFAERERQRAEDALSAINSSLSETVARRTSELQLLNDELRKEIINRRAIEQALRESESKNVALISALPDWIFRLRTDGTLLDLRCPRSQNVPGNFQLLEKMPAGLADQIVSWVRQNQKIETGETVSLRFPEQDTTYEARFVPAGDAEILAVVRDISEITRLEREVVEANIREQRRIGEELHDGLGQQLTAIAFIAKLLELELNERKMEEPAAQASAIGKQLSGAIGAIRALSRGLFRYELGSDSLVTALQELASLADKNFQVQCTLDADSTIDLSDRAADLHLYRITQEAISNAVKHGHAKNISLQLKRDGPRIIFTIRDDGDGCDQIKEQDNGIGLRTMEYRTRRLGGRLGIESSPGHGTVITCTLPDPAINPPTWDQTQQLLLFS